MSVTDAARSGSPAGAPAQAGGTGTALSSDAQQTVRVAGGAETSAPARRSAAGLGLRWLLRAVSLGVTVLVWHLLTSNDVEMWLRFSKIPGPAEALAELWHQVTEDHLLMHVQASTWRIAQGFGLAAVAGVAAGVAIGRSRLVCDAVAPVLEVVRPIPAIAWVPMAILLFPTGEQGIVFITFLAALFPVVVATRHAVRALPFVWEDAVRTMGASRRTILWRVVLPGSLPGIFSGLSVAMGVAWICVISAEMISGQAGVGYLTWMSYSLINYPAVLVGMITIGFLGLVSAGLVELAGRWATRWLPRAEVQA